MRKAILHLKQSDPVLAGIIDRVGTYRIEFREPEFPTLVRSIVYQQLNGKAAFTILSRLLGALPDGRLTPDAILALTLEEMRALGLSGQKAAYIRDLAERTRSGDLDFARFLDFIQVRTNAPCAGYPVSTAANARRDGDRLASAGSADRSARGRGTRPRRRFGPHAFAFT